MADFQIQQIETVPNYQENFEKPAYIRILGWILALLIFALIILIGIAVFANFGSKKAGDEVERPNQPATTPIVEPEQIQFPQVPESRFDITQ